MSIRIKRRWVLAISCLIISGCTEKTIIREVPSSTEPEASLPDTVVPDVGSPLDPLIDGDTNMVSEETDSEQLEDLQAGGDSNMVPVEPDTDTDQLEDPLATEETDEEAEEVIDEATDEEAEEVIDEATDEEVEEIIDEATDEEVEEVIDEATDEEVEEATDEEVEEVTDEEAEEEIVEGPEDTSVDCANTVPCTWTSDDSQFSVTITNADNIGSQGQLQLNYTFESIHDTQVSIAGGGQATDDAGREIQPSGQTLGSSNGGTTQPLLAGSPLSGRIVFDRATESTSLSAWSITILDGGVARMPAFSNIPVGTITTAHADCELVLPCVWSTPQGDVSITLTSAGGYTINSRLSITFSILSTKTVDVALEAGAFAISSEGVQFAGRTHTLGTGNGYSKITAEAYAGFGLTGSVEYSRNSTVATALNEVSLILYQNDPVPRWNPKFTNVPVL